MKQLYPYGNHIYASSQTETELIYVTVDDTKTPLVKNVTGKLGVQNIGFSILFLILKIIKAKSYLLAAKEYGLY